MSTGSTEKKINWVWKLRLNSINLNLALPEGGGVVGVKTKERNGKTISISAITVL